MGYEYTSSMFLRILIDVSIIIYNIPREIALSMIICDVQLKFPNGAFQLFHNTLYDWTKNRHEHSIKKAIEILEDKYNWL